MFERQCAILKTRENVILAAHVHNDGAPTEYALVAANAIGADGLILVTRESIVARPIYGMTRALVLAEDPWT